MTSATIATPVGVMDAVEVECGNDHTCFRRRIVGGGHRVTCAGVNNYGQLGDGTAANRSSHTLDVLGLPTDVVDLGSGASGDNTCARTASGRVYCWGTGAVGSWGLNGNGQVGDGTRTNRRMPVPVVGL